jgi:tripartite-type tricarboxylate transporter receptor subunit TctC
MVTGGTGGSSDVVSRLLAQGLTAGLDQQVIVDSRPSGVIPGQIVMAAPPDGYTLLLSSGSLWIAPLMQKTPYDAVKDFATISLTNVAPNVLVVTPSLPVKSVADLISLAKAKPGALNYSTSAVGGSGHLAAELFNHMAGVSTVHIPYKAAGLALTDLMAGRVQLAFATAGSVTSHVKSGKLRGLAVTSLKPSLLFPELPTVAGSGLPGYESITIHGLFAPAGTPAAPLKRLHLETARYLETAPAKERFLAAGLEAVGSSPAEFTAKIKSEVARLQTVIRSAGIRIE